MTTQWKINTYSSSEKADAEQLRSQVPMCKATSLILAKRGITNEAEYNRFIKPSLSDLHDPFLMNDMDKAVARLNDAIGQCHKIMIYGDYDVDGTTSVALIYRFLRETVYSDKYLNFYIPDRYDDGYGISKRGIDIAHEWGAKLIIVLDCGIKAVEEIDYAKSLGIDFIVCDHHNPSDTLPNAVAILNPKRSDNTYPFEHLSGCGVGFKLLQAFSISNNIHLKYLTKHIELLALSIAADIVPVIDENRILAYHGLRQLNSHPSMGVRGIMKISSLEDKHIDMQSIIFKMGPRINASGRMMNGRETVELLISKDSKTVRSKSDEIDGYNKQRREMDTKVTKEALQMIKENPDILKRKIIVISSNKWHKGVIGIVASRIAERYNKPTIVLTCSDGCFSGSARSVGGFDLYKAVEYCKDLLANFGGHPYAVGLTIPKENLDKFISIIDSYATEHLEKSVIYNTIGVDAELQIDEITPQLLKEISLLAPFGACNENPMFLTKNIIDDGLSKIVGRDKKHLRVSIADKDKHEKPIYGIAFRQADKAERIMNKEPYSIIYTLEDTPFNHRGVQLNIKDIRID